MTRTITAAALVGVLSFAGATGAATIADAPAAGQVLWLFTGAKASAAVSTVVHCTNLDPTKTATLTVEFWDNFGSLLDSATESVPPGGVADTSTLAGTMYAEALTNATNFQGSVRVIADATKKIICSAQVMSSATPPTFAFDLTPFNKSAKH